MTLREDTLFEEIEIIYCFGYSHDKPYVEDYQFGDILAHMATVRVDDRRVLIYRVGAPGYQSFRGFLDTGTDIGTEILEPHNNMYHMVDACINYLITDVRP
jgi:hypothetical protein